MRSRVPALLAALATFAVLAMEVGRFRRIEAAIAALVGVVVIAFTLELVIARPPAGSVAGGVFVPKLPGGAALLAVRGRPGGRRPPRTVWDMLRVVSPELARWSDYFAAGAGLRSAIEAGRFDAVSEARAEQALCAAEDFVDELRTLLAADASTTSPGYGAANRPLGLRAS